MCRVRGMTIPWGQTFKRQTIECTDLFAYEGMMDQEGLKWCGITRIR